VDCPRTANAHHRCRTALQAHQDLQAPPDNQVLPVSQANPVTTVLQELPPNRAHLRTPAASSARVDRQALQARMALQDHQAKTVNQEIQAKAEVKDPQDPQARAEILVRPEPQEIPERLDNLAKTAPAPSPLPAPRDRMDHQAHQDPQARMEVQVNPDHSARPALPVNQEIPALPARTDSPANPEDLACLDRTRPTARARNEPRCSFSVNSVDALVALVSLWALQNAKLPFREIAHR